MKQILRNIWIGIKNLITWFPVIWNDRQWDYTFIFIVLKRKLELMKDLFENDAYTEKAPEVVDKLKRCIILLDRLSDDSIYFDEANTKFNYTFDKNRTKINMEMLMAMGVYEEKLFQDDLNELTIILHDHIKEWWD